MPTIYDSPRVPTFDATPFSSEEQAALDWLDDLCEQDMSVRIFRAKRCWALTFDDGGSDFRGHPAETLRALVLHAYRTCQLCPSCANPITDNNGEVHHCPALFI